MPEVLLLPAVAPYPALPSLVLQTAPLMVFPSLRWWRFGDSHLCFRFGVPCCKKADENQHTPLLVELSSRALSDAAKVFQVWVCMYIPICVFDTPASNMQLQPGFG